MMKFQRQFAMQIWTLSALQNRSSNPTYQTTSYQFRVFNIIRLDRENSEHGGVCTFNILLDIVDNKFCRFKSGFYDSQRAYNPLLLELFILSPSLFICKKRCRMWKLGSLTAELLFLVISTSWTWPVLKTLTASNKSPHFQLVVTANWTLCLPIWLHFMMSP